MKICTKTVFATESAAKAVIIQIEKKHQKRKRPTRAYKCSDCGKWHLTSQPDYEALFKEFEAFKKESDELRTELQTLKNERVIAKLEGKD